MRSGQQDLLREGNDEWAQERYHLNSWYGLFDMTRGKYVGTFVAAVGATTFFLAEANYISLNYSYLGLAEMFGGVAVNVIKSRGTGSEEPELLMRQRARFFR